LPEQENSIDLRLSTERAFSNLSSRFETQFHLGELFIKQLCDKVKRAPRNGRTGLRELMVTIFDFKQITLARNCLCSSRSVNLSDTYHVFIALDSIALSAFLKFHPPILFLNLSGRGFGYHQLTRVKLFIQLLLLSWNVEATVCDTDLVFLRNPRELFTEDSHFEAMVEVPKLDFPRNYPWSALNVGFMRVLPSELSITLYRHWLIRALKNMNTLDQHALSNMLYKKEVFVEKSTVWFNISEFTSIQQLFKLRYYDPLFVQNGVMMRSMASQFRELARRRNISEPYICHLSYIRPQSKIKVLVESGLWFLAPQDRSCSALPDKRLYQKWKQ
jgi:hypothetical protein